MINFHKYGFLDVKKLKRHLEGKSYWLCRYNPVWLFIWSDLYKPEIAFEGDLCFIRYLMPEIGMCYYPPIGTGDIAEGLKKIRLDCAEHGYELNLAPFSEDMLYSYAVLGYPLKENVELKSYVYSCADLAFPKNKRTKATLKKFKQEHKDAVYRKIKKEDFPRILEFIGKWEERERPVQGALYFAKLNSVKQLIEHLYEFDLLSVLLYEEERIYGIAAADITGNTAYTLLYMALPDCIGASEELLLCLAKEAGCYARYLNLGEANSPEEKACLMRLKPLKQERYYSTFRL